MFHTLRTRIKKKIIAEFVSPLKKSDRVIILCGGIPGYPAKKDLMFFLAEKGYWVFSPKEYLIGSSFGGPAVILASKDKRVRKAIAFSPMIDQYDPKLVPIWNELTEEQKQ